MKIVIENKFDFRKDDVIYFSPYDCEQLLLEESSAFSLKNNSNKLYVGKVTEIIDNIVQIEVDKESVWSELFIECINNSFINKKLYHKQLNNGKILYLK